VKERYFPALTKPAAILEITRRDAIVTTANAAECCQPCWVNPVYHVDCASAQGPGLWEAASVTQ
jgi:hypothetical protein